RCEDAPYVGDVSRALLEVRFDAVLEHEAVEALEIDGDLAAVLVIEGVEVLRDDRQRSSEKMTELGEIALLVRLLGTREEAQTAIEDQDEELAAVRGGDLRLLVLAQRRLRGAHQVLLRAPASRPCCDCRLLTRISRL